MYAPVALRARPEHGGGAPRGAVFASGFIRAIRFPRETTGRAWPATSARERSTREITDRSVRGGDESAQAQCVQTPPTSSRSSAGVTHGSASFPGCGPILATIDVSRDRSHVAVHTTFGLLQRRPPFGLHHVHASSECYFGLNLNPMNSNPAEGLLHPPSGHHGLRRVPPLYRSGTRAGPPVTLSRPRQREARPEGTSSSSPPTLLSIYAYRFVSVSCRRDGVLRDWPVPEQSPTVFTFVRRKNVALSIDSDKTDEVGSHACREERRVNHLLEPFGGNTIPGTLATPIRPASPATFMFCALGTPARRHRYPSVGVRRLLPRPWKRSH
ncbi:hypothetical protein J5N97_011763 [Dioscorea zingiberensis]|uniref:Uncharacterized protein n=1 Tax=Dioscorea zingiberensis TaxID=325984 RepID=A0A9D5HNX3_9LILI|nr:hypothetical protein J5N97_011763 [Dioscorea zingiberensis]